MPGRILGVDYGEKRIGVAISDPLCLIATPKLTIQHTRQRSDFAIIKELCHGLGVETIVVGVPTDSGGGIGTQAERVISWAGKLSDVVKLPVIFQDETLSSQFAETLNTSNRRRKAVDHIAAAKILQDYLDQKLDKRTRGLDECE